MEIQPLLANIGDVIGVLITIAIIGFSIISKILSANNDVKANKPPDRRPPPQRPRVQPKPAAQGIESEIEEFLRQARGGAPQPQPPQGRPQPPPPALPVRPQPQIIEAVPVHEDIVPGRDFARGLTAHVDEHIGQDSISQRDAHLGERVERADERIEHHLEEVFDHDVGRLSHAYDVDTSIADGTDAHSWEEEAPKQVPSSSDAIVAMLNSPENIRNVFILTEIFKRPEI